MLRCSRNCLVELWKSLVWHWALLVWTTLGPLTLCHLAGMEELSNCHSLGSFCGHRRSVTEMSTHLYTGEHPQHGNSETPQASPLCPVQGP